MTRLLFGVVVLVSSPACATQVVVLAGQSNADGRATASALAGELFEPTPSVPIYADATDRLELRQGLLGRLVPTRPGLGDSFGPEVALAKVLHLAPAGVRFAIAKYARGATSLERDWSSGGNHWRQLTSAVDSALKSLPTTGGQSPKVAALVWVHGAYEAKRGVTVERYKAALSDLIARSRSIWGDQLPVIIARSSARQSSLPPSGLRNVRLAQQRVADSTRGCWLTDTDLMSFADDNLHFDATGQISLGAACGWQVLEAVQATPQEARSLREWTGWQDVLARSRVEPNEPAENGRGALIGYIGAAIAGVVVGAAGARLIAAHPSRNGHPG